ncbi:Uncharacterised protein [Serratia liquefaciens]|nr:Uncharacterised protein [Serratia liquefaciens]
MCGKRRRNKWKFRYQRTAIVDDLPGESCMAPRINLTQPIAQYRDSFTLRRQRAAVRDPSMPNASPLVMVIPLCASVSLNSFPSRRHTRSASDCQ